METCPTDASSQHTNSFRRLGNVVYKSCLLFLAGFYLGAWLALVEERLAVFYRRAWPILLSNIQGEGKRIIVNEQNIAKVLNHY